MDSEATLEELKPCPFCGQAGIVKQFVGEWVAGCENMECEMFTASAPKNAPATKAGVIAIWNTRAPQPAKEQRHELPNL